MAAITALDGHGRAATHLLAARGTGPALLELLDLGLPPAVLLVRDGKGGTPAQHAAYHGNTGFLLALAKAVRQPSGNLLYNLATDAAISAAARATAAAAASCYLAAALQRMVLAAAFAAPAAAVAAGGFSAVGHFHVVGGAAAKITALARLPRLGAAVSP